MIVEFEQEYLSELYNHIVLFYSTKIGNYIDKFTQLVNFILVEKLEKLAYIYTLEKNSPT